MSYVIAVPELLQSAADDLAGLRASLTEAVAAAAGPTTAIATAAQDEISDAVATMFASFGADFQAAHARAHAFGEHFAGSLNGAGVAYASAESSSYRTLFANTATNLQALENAVAANPAPFLRQFASNQLEFAQAVFGQQIGYAQTVSTALVNAAQDFGAGVSALPAALQAATQQLAAGDVTGAVRGVATGFGNLFLTGLSASQDPTTLLINITPTGTLGDLLPILRLPGQMAQNLTDMLPSGSVPAQISQHLTNVINTLTDTSQTLDLVTGDLHVGLPLVLGLEAIGPVVTTANAFCDSANAVLGALQTGNVLSAGAALLDTPAAVLDGFLNGQATLPLSVTLGDLTTTTNVPLGGILAPARTASLTLEIFGTTGTIPLFGTAFGGILPGLLTFLPEQLAEAIGGLPALP
ncbi:PE family protein [Mycobacterium sp. Z3061]|uniref:PE family protein n=1 Tax=Mycobacterium sp. Z3061 TaxID=3073562 RepID=UPI0028731377|nr:PE family protein [Mycobacterium sp. Z3061]